MNKLFESSKALAGLPKHWIKYLANRYGSRGAADLAGKNSEIIPLKAFQKSEVSKTLKDENNLGIVGKIGKSPIFMIAKHPDKTTRYLFFKEKEGEGRYNSYGWTRRKGGRRSNFTYEDDFTFDEVYDIIKKMQEDISFDDLNIYAITKDPYRMSTSRKRYQERLKKDPLYSEPAGFQNNTPSEKQTEIAKKYANIKRQKLDKRLNFEIEKIKTQISDELDKAFEKIINDIKKGYTWNLDKKEIGQKILRDINIDTILKLANVYDALNVDYSGETPIGILNKLRSSVKK